MSIDDESDVEMWGQMFLRTNFLFTRLILIK